MPKQTAGPNLLTSSTLRVAAALATSSLLALAAGCATGSPASPAIDATGLSGTVHGGQAPVTGSNIALYVSTPAGAGGTGSTAYGASLTSAYQTVTDATGSFRIPAGSYTCPTGSYVYIVSTGGNPGSSVAGTDNSAIFLVAALGSCANVSSTTQVVINEVTTVAAAYALGGFAPANGTGMTEGTVLGNTAKGLTTSTTNAQGLADAFANAANIVNVAGGGPNATTVGGNGTVPVTLINTLGDILQDCVNSTGPTGTSVYGGRSCSTLFTAATSPSGVAPVNVWQAALNIAQYPALNVTSLYGMVSAQSAFQPSLAAQPNDLSIGIVYTSANLVSPQGLGIDKNDNVYVTGSTTADLLEFSGQGALLSPATGWTTASTPATLTSGTTDNIRTLTFDTAGSIWLSDGNSSGQGVYQYVPAGPAKSPTQGTLTAEPYAAATMDFNNYAITTDKTGNIFGLSYKKSTCATETQASSTGCLLYELPVGSSPAYSATSAFSGGVVASPGVGGARSAIYDTNLNNIWFTDIAEGDVSFLTVTPNATGAVTVAKAVQNINLSTAAAGSPTSGFGAVSVAIDAAGNGYTVLTGSGTSTTVTVPASLYAVNPTTAAVTNFCSATYNAAPCAAFNTLAYDAIGGNGNVFIAQSGTGAGNSAIVEFSPALNGTTSGSSTVSGFVSGQYGISPGATQASGVFTNSALYEPTAIAIDRAGSVWTLNTGSGATGKAAGLVQIIGLAGPTNPVSYAGQYGVKP